MITANGTANDQYLEISGSGRYLTDGLTSETVKARICGSGTASVVAMDVLDVKISGSGSLTYWGNFFDFRATYAEAPKHGARISPVRITLPDGEVVSYPDGVTAALNMISSEARINTRRSVKPETGSITAVRPLRIFAKGRTRYMAKAQDQRL